MEIPYSGRATIDDQFDHVEITIPARKNWFVIFFLSFWLCGWTAGEATAIWTLTGGHTNGAIDTFMGVWLCGWTVGGLFALRTFLWMVAGKEIISVGQGIIMINRRFALFVRPKTYDLHEAKNFRTEEDTNATQSMWGNRQRTNHFNIADSGTIRFDYGMSTVKFGGGVDVVEAGYILQGLKDKKILTDQNFVNKNGETRGKQGNY